MTNQAERTTTEPITLPAGIALDDLVNAVSRGVGEALAARDDVGGYLFGSIQMPVVLTTIVYCPAPPPQDPRYPGPIFEQGVDSRVS